MDETISCTFGATFVLTMIDVTGNLFFLSEDNRDVFEKATGMFN